MPSIKNILELRQHLKMPQLRSGSERLTELAQASASDVSFDDLISGRLPKGAITEWVQDKPSAGSSFLLSAFVRRVCPAHWVAWIDGQDNFDPAAFDEAVLGRLLWIRCRRADAALKAADLLLRDGNIPFVLLDLATVPVRQLRSIPSSTWYRFQRILEPSSTALLVVLPCHLIGCARLKCTWQTSFNLEALAQPESELLRRLQIQFDQKLLATAGDSEPKLAQAG